MNRRQAKFAARKAMAAAALEREIAEAWDQAHVWNAIVDKRAADDAEYAALLATPRPEFATVEEFFAQFDGLDAE